MEAIQLPLPKQPSESRQLSFRDPLGQVYADERSIIRKVRPDSVVALQTLLRTKTVQNWVGKGKLISTEQTAPNEFRHPKIFFPSYPHEWTPHMLYQAAHLTLDLFLDAEKEGYGLKDASSRNILYSGTNPVFIDLLSLEKRHPNDGTWMAFEQFLRHFIYPLALVKARRMSLKSYFLSATDGMSPLAVGEKMGLMAYHPRYFSLIAVPYWLTKLATKRKWNEKRVQKFTSSPKEASFILKILIKHLRNGLERVAPEATDVTLWSDYDAKTCPYEAEALKKKEAYLNDVFKKYKPKSVLDLGCNQGKYSRIAAQNGAKVVALDFDEACVQEVWNQSKKEKTDILPICMSISEPTPALGWRNAETHSFIDRASDKFEMTLSLALFHHLILQSIPLEEVLSFIHHTSKRYVVLEYVGQGDSQVKQGLIQRGNSIRYPSKEEFITACATDFKIVERKLLGAMDRELFILEKISSPSHS